MSDPTLHAMQAGQWLIQSSCVRCSPPPKLQNFAWMCSSAEWSDGGGLKQEWHNGLELLTEFAVLPRGSMSDKAATWIGPAGLRLGAERLMCSGGVCQRWGVHGTAVEAVPLQHAPAAVMTCQPALRQSCTSLPHLCHGDVKTSRMLLD